VEKLDGREFKGQRVTCVANVGLPVQYCHVLDHVLTPRQTQPEPVNGFGRGDRMRSRSPRRPYPPPIDDYDRRGAPRGGRGYSPRRDGGGYRDDYRARSPRRDYDYDRRGGRYPSPPRGPVDDYPPPRGRYDDPYRRDYPPEPYVNGRAPYDRPPPPRDFPPRDGAYPRDNGYPPRDGGYERRGYW
jgi:hypothetical protein